VVSFKEAGSQRKCACATVSAIGEPEPLLDAAGVGGLGSARRRRLRAAGCHVALTRTGTGGRRGYSIPVISEEHPPRYFRNSELINWPCRSIIWSTAFLACSCS
jgi:hypothetical protein